jgi:hypothetical protein
MLLVILALITFPLLVLVRIGYSRGLLSRRAVAVASTLVWGSGMIAAVSFPSATGHSALDVTCGATLGLALGAISVAILTH